jgi:hypothetical protein
MSDLARDFGEVLRAWLRAQDPATVAALTAALDSAAPGISEVAAKDIVAAAGGSGAGFVGSMAAQTVLPADLTLGAGLTTGLINAPLTLNPSPNGKWNCACSAQLLLESPALSAVTPFSMACTGLVGGAVTDQVVSERSFPVGTTYRSSSVASVVLFGIPDGSDVNARLDVDAGSASGFVAKKLDSLFTLAATLVAVVAWPA